MWGALSDERTGADFPESKYGIEYGGKIEIV
jgi:hypothetical protein